MEFKYDDAAIAAGQVLARRSVEFTEDRRYDSVKAYPFHYPFVTPNLIEANNGVIPIGWSVPAGSVTDIPIVLDRDKIWHLLNLKYCAYENIEDDSYRWWDESVYPYEENFTARTGLISIPAASVNITGAGTNFDPEITVGDIIAYLDDTGVRHYGQIATRTNDTTATLVTAAAAAATSQSYTRAGVVAPSGGTPVLTAGSALVGGVGCAYDVDLSPGDWIGVMDGNSFYAMQVLSIQGPDDLTLVSPSPVTLGGELYAILNYSAWATPWLPGTQAIKGNIPRLRYLTDYLRVTLFFPALGDLYSYGIPQRLLGDVPNNGLIERRVMVHALQGANSGLCMLRTPMQLPYEGQVVVRVQNIHSTKDLFVNGSLFGYKVRV